MRPFDNAAVLALGGAGLALPDQDHGIVNDAQLGLGTNKLAVFAGTAIPYSIGGWQAHQFQGMFAVGKNSGFGVEVLHAGLESYQEQRFQLGYGRRLSDKLLLGAHFQLLRVSAQEYGSANGVSGGLSVLAEPISNLWLGAKLDYPFGVTLDEEQLPTRLQIGATWKSSAALLLTGGVDKDLDRPAQINAGLEYRPVEAVRIRAGMRSGPGRLCLGLGYRLKNGISLDAGAEWHPVLGITPALMVAWHR